MNLVSAITGIAIMGAAAPGVMEMSIQPFMAQKRAANFSIAESAAVTFAAANEGQQSVASAPDGCSLAAQPDDVYSITCTNGEGQFVQTATRSFRLAVDTQGGGGSPDSQFAYPAPPGFTPHQCHAHEDWGLNTSAFDKTTNTWRGKSCIPPDAWAAVWYRNSNPDNWRYNIDNFNGWGSRL